MNKLKRYIIFIIGLFINSLGVSLITKASLGTSPISSIPYVLSLNYPLTLGNFTIIFSILLIVLQIIILRKNFKIENKLTVNADESNKILASTLINNFFPKGIC